MRVMKKPTKVALRPRWWRRVRNEWSVQATKKAGRGARSRARGSYWDKNEFAEALKLIRNDFKEESIANDEEQERMKEGYDIICVLSVEKDDDEYVRYWYNWGFTIIYLFVCLFIYILSRARYALRFRRRLRCVVVVGVLSSPELISF